MNIKKITPGLPLPAAVQLRQDVQALADPLSLGDNWPLGSIRDGPKVYPVFDTTFEDLRAWTVPEFTANQNDFYTQGYNWLLLSSDALRDFTGMTGGSSGVRCHLTNVSTTQSITVKHYSSSSLAVNRFFCAGSADITLGPGQTVEAVHDGTYWRAGAVVTTSSTITVDGIHGTPITVPNVADLQFDQSDGFVVSSPSGGTALVNLAYNFGTTNNQSVAPTHPPLILPTCTGAGTPSFSGSTIGQIIVSIVAGVATAYVWTGAAWVIIVPGGAAVHNFVEHIYTGSGTWTQPANLDFLLVWCVAAGAGGGGAQGVGYQAAGGGGAGGVSYRRIPAASLGATEDYTVGTGGAGGVWGVAGGDGTDGGDTEFAVPMMGSPLVRAKGGSGGKGVGTFPDFNIAPGGAPGAPGGGIGDICGSGDWGREGYSSPTTNDLYSGTGGDCSPYGSGGTNLWDASGDGGIGQGYGSGGGGAAGTGGADGVGGIGAYGLIIVHEYYTA